MPLATINSELQSVVTDPRLRDNDKVLKEALGEIYSNKNLGLNVRTFAAAATMHESDALCLCDGTSAFALTLPAANTWSSRDVKKTPILFFIHTTGANNVTLTAAGSDTIDGGATLALASTKRKILVSDGNTAWYSVPV